MKHLPNAISIARLLCVPVVGWLAHEGREHALAALLLAAGASDLIDGWIARRFGWTSATGALLDSIADVLLVVVTLFAIWLLHREVFVVHGLVIWAVTGIWLVVHAAALLRYRRLASFHTRFTQLGVGSFGVFALVLFFHGFVGWIYYLAGVICFLGGLESLVMIWLLPRWTPDLRGGILAALRERSRPTSS